MKNESEADIGRTPFGERLRSSRRAKKLTQIQAAAKVGMAQSGLAELEKEGTGSSFVVALALLYGVNPVWLALNQGPKCGGLPAPGWLLELQEDELERVENFARNLISSRSQKNSGIGANNKVSSKTKTKKEDEFKPGFPMVSNGN